MYCKNSFDSSVDCLNSYYTKLDENNEIEWSISLKKWWWNQMKIAWFGWLFIPMAGFFGVMQLIFPDLKPDIDNAPWRDRETPLRSNWYKYYTYVSQISEPNLFFFTQILTLGESDLRDFSIIYMNNFEAFIYSIINQLDILTSYPYAILHTTIFGPVYAVQLIIWLFKGFFGDNKGGRGGRGGQGGNGQRGGNGNGSTPPMN